MLALSSMMEIKPNGQADSQLPQPVHFSLSNFSVMGSPVHSELFR
jgi:hypothetical protein